MNDVSVRGSVAVPTAFHRAEVSVLADPGGGAIALRIDEAPDARGREANWVEVRLTAGTALACAGAACGPGVEVLAVPVCDGVPLRLLVTPEALREHFAASARVAAMGATDLMRVGAFVLDSDRLYRVFHQVLVEGFAALYHFDPGARDGPVDHTDPDPHRVG